MESSGIWLDAGIDNTRLCNSVIYDVTSGFGGIFIEVSRYRADQVQSADFLQPVQRVCDQLMLMHRDPLHPDIAKIIHRGPQADRFSNGRCAGLKFMR